MPSISTPQLYSIWFTVLWQLVPGAPDTQIANCVFLITGIFQAGSVHLSLVARKIPVRVKKLSLVRRLERWLDNGAIRPREWYRPMAEQLIAAASVAGEVHLLIDCSKVSFNHQLLMVAIAYKRRSLPLAWTWVCHKRGHSTVRKQLALLAYVRSLIPEGVKVSLAGDTEFGHVPVIEQLKKWHWDYALRQQGRYLVQRKDSDQWVSLGSLIQKVGEMLWFGEVSLTRLHACRTHLTLYWAKGEKEPWLLATNLTNPQHVLRLYRRRMWLEEMFGDLKGHGFDLEASRLRHFLRLSRLTLVVALLYVWLVAFGSHVVYNGQRSQVDRNDRRDLSIFRIGWDFIEQLLAWSEPLEVILIPIFDPLPGFDDEPLFDVG